jgi:hypothetical protein
MLQVQTSCTNNAAFEKKKKVRTVYLPGLVQNAKKEIH